MCRCGEQNHYVSHSRRMHKNTNMMGFCSSSVHVSFPDEKKRSSNQPKLVCWLAYQPVCTGDSGTFQTCQIELYEKPDEQQLSGLSEQTYYGFQKPTQCKLKKKIYSLI